VRRALAWLRRWGVSSASFVGGLLTLFVFRRGLPHVGWIIGYLLLLWLLVGVVTQVRQALEARGHRLVVTAADYTIQSLYHGILLFVLPGYWAATTLTSVNATFFGLLVVLILLATFDPWYQAVVQPRPWVGHVFFLVSIFAALNVALPLVGLPPYPALIASAFIAVAALAPALRRAGALSWPAAFRRSIALAVVAATVAAVGRAWIPPAPLFLARTALAWNVASIESLEPRPRGIDVGELRERGLVAHTAVYAPAGLKQPIAHVWRHEGRVVNVVGLSPIEGGRREGFRTYSRKTEFPADAVGRWSVDVVTSSGQLIGRLRFRVTGR
jgi:hypothetical protein